jgi:hypothetical protein
MADCGPNIYYLFLRHPWFKQENLQEIIASNMVVGIHAIPPEHDLYRITGHQKDGPAQLFQ